MSFIDDVQNLDKTFITYGKSIINEAYKEFITEHEYDPRDSGDKLLFSSWKVEGNKVKLTYIEKTPHDRPYSIIIYKNINDINGN